MIEWVFIRGVTEHFHDGALFLGRSAAPLLVQEAGGNRLLWTQSLDWGGGKLGRKEKCKQWRGADNGTDGDRSGEQKGRDESYHCSQPGPC